MVRFPLVSRLAYDEACRARDRAESQVDTLLDHVRRVERVERGMTEMPRQQKPAEVMPDDMIAYVQGWGSPETQSSVEDGLWKLYRRLRDWDKVRAAITEADDAMNAEPM